MSAGIHYSPQFAEMKYSRNVTGHVWVVPIGAASVQMFDDLIPRVVDKGSRVSALSAEELAAHGLDMIIAPTVEHFDFLTGFDTDSERFSVAYRMTLYTNRGVPIASWVVVGDRPSKAFGIWGAVEDDMTDAAVKFLNGFEREATAVLAGIQRSKEAKSVPLSVRDVLLRTERAELPNLNPSQLTALQEAGVLGLKVTATNQTDRPLVVRASDMRLRLDDGKLLEPAALSSVLSVLDKSSNTGAVVAAFTGPLIGLLAAYDEEQSKQAERALQVKTGSQSLFLERQLGRDKEETGIVFFQLPKAMDLKEGAVLRVWVVDPPAAEGEQVNVAVPAAR